MGRTDLCSGITVTQRDHFQIITVGSSAKIHCEHDDASYITILWYRQERHGEKRQLQLIAHSVQGNDPQIEVKEYSIDRPSVKEASLSTPEQKAEDSAVYFCAARGQAETLYFGQGTRLTVVESKDDISPPTVTIFDPSAQELQEKQKVTIVCLVTDFYPDHVNLTWSVDGDERTKGVKTKEPDLDKAAKKFSLISRLRITRKEWEKTKEIQCNVYFDPLKQNYTGTIRGQVCDGSDALKEPYLRSNNLGKLIYILLIFKSTLYGAFITGLMLRKKSMKEKPFA
nr:TRBV6.4 [Tiliqua rugosa]